MDQDLNFVEEQDLNIKDLLAWTRCLCGYFRQDHISCKGLNCLTGPELDLVITQSYLLNGNP